MTYEHAIFFLISSNLLLFFTICCLKTAPKQTKTTVNMWSMKIHHAVSVQLEVKLTNTQMVM